MEWFAAVVVILPLAAAMSGIALLARRVRRRGTAGQAFAAAMAAFDEGFHSTAHDTFVEVAAQGQRGQQAPAPRWPRGDSARREELT